MVCFFLGCLSGWLFRLYLCGFSVVFKILGVRKFDGFKSQPSFEVLIEGPLSFGCTSHVDRISHGKGAFSDLKPDDLNGKLHERHT